MDERRNIMFSVAIVSNARPDMLLRCLKGCAQLYYAWFEVIVVADQAGCDAVGRSEFSDRVTLILFDDLNISAARNQAIVQSGGDIIAFIDDDAVPEPTWLCVMAEAFENVEVQAVCGWVRGRNGISFQSQSDGIGWNGLTRSYKPSPDMVPKLVGTNMAIRRDALMSVSGFDERYAFYLEDADLSIRLAAAGQHIAHISDAQVHHAFAASARRQKDRTPQDLTQIGRSLKVFLQTHCPDAQRDYAFEAHRENERKRVLRYMVSGGLEPRQVNKHLAEFDQGYAAPVDPYRMPSFSGKGTKSKLFPRRRAPSTAIFVAGRVTSRSAAKAAARTLSEQGNCVSVKIFSRSFARHRLYFHADGYWLQSGGISGKSLRKGQWPRWWSFRRRVSVEVKRVTHVRCPRGAKSLPQLRWI